MNNSETLQDKKMTDSESILRHHIKRSQLALKGRRRVPRKVTIQSVKSFISSLKYENLKSQNQQKNSSINEQTLSILYNLLLLRYYLRWISADIPPFHIPSEINLYVNTLSIEDCKLFCSDSSSILNFVQNQLHDTINILIDHNYSNILSKTISQAYIPNIEYAINTMVSAKLQSDSVCITYLLQKKKNYKNINRKAQLLKKKLDMVSQTRKLNSSTPLALQSEKTLIAYSLARNSALDDISYTETNNTSKCGLIDKNMSFASSYLTKNQTNNRSFKYIPKSHLKSHIKRLEKNTAINQYTDLILLVYKKSSHERISYQKYEPLFSSKNQTKKSLNVSHINDFNFMQLFNYSIFNSECKDDSKLYENLMVFKNNSIYFPYKGAMMTMKHLYHYYNSIIRYLLRFKELYPFLSQNNLFLSNIFFLLISSNSINRPFFYRCRYILHKGFKYIFRTLTIKSTKDAHLNKKSLKYSKENQNTNNLNYSISNVDSISRVQCLFKSLHLNGTLKSPGSCYVTIVDPHYNVANKYHASFQRVMLSRKKMHCFYNKYVFSNILFNSAIKVRVSKETFKISLSNFFNKHEFYAFSLSKMLLLYNLNNIALNNDIIYSDRHKILGKAYRTVNSLSLVKNEFVSISSQKISLSNCSGYAKHKIKKLNYFLAISTNKRNSKLVSLHNGFFNLADSTGGSPPLNASSIPGSISSNSLEITKEIKSGTKTSSRRSVTTVTGFEVLPSITSESVGSRSLPVLGLRSEITGVHQPVFLRDKHAEPKRLSSSHMKVAIQTPDGEYLKWKTLLATLNQFSKPSELLPFAPEKPTPPGDQNPSYHHFPPDFAHRPIQIHSGILHLPAIKDTAAGQKLKESGIHISPNNRTRGVYLAKLIWGSCVAGLAAHKL